MNRKLTVLWFLLGLGSRLQVVASLSITEMIVLASAPFLFLRNYRQMKRDGLMPLFVLSVMVIIGCIVSSVVNHTPGQHVLRGLAVTCIVSCAVVFSHWIVRGDPDGFKWYILAIPLSAVISTFVFRASVEVSMLGDSAEEIASGSTFWIGRLRLLVLAPTKGWYLQMPGMVNLFAPLFMAGFAILSTASGRSAALAGIGFFVIVLIGGKTRKSMNRLSRYFWLLCLIGIAVIGFAYVGYKVSASKGWLGEDARRKYEIQTGGGAGGIGRLILGGRGESFIGLLGCRDRPIVGWGPWAKDKNGYTEEFLEKYGTIEDYQKFVRYQMAMSRLGITERMLSCHAYITEFWAWYGILGLVFWLYVIYVFLRYIKQDVAAVPQWFAWLACSMPETFWGIFFSPFADRVGVPLLVVACLMARAVRKGVFRLPQEMMQEIN